MAEKPTTLEQWKWDKLSEPDFAREYVAQLEAEIKRLEKAFDWSAQKCARLEAEITKHSDAVAGAQLFAIELKAKNEQLRGDVGGAARRLVAGQWEEPMKTLCDIAGLHYPAEVNDD